MSNPVTQIRGTEESLSTLNLNKLPQEIHERYILLVDIYNIFYTYFINFY